MERIFRWEIKDEQVGMTIEQFLRAHGCSHRVLAHLKRTECGILRNGLWAYANQKLEYKDELKIRVVEEVSSPNIVPVKMPLDIVYEDDDLMIVNKMSNTPIHPSAGNHTNTLANGVMHYFHAQNIPYIYRCINRLDRDTSGLLILAKNMVSASLLSQMSASRQLHREYLAVVDGYLPPSGCIDAPIARAENSAIMRRVDPTDGESAITHYTCIARGTAPCASLSASSCQDTTNGDENGCANGSLLSLARIRLETGRTHQIRVHMKHIGHPLIGDFLYNPASTNLIGRQALHSHSLSFAHPITGETLSFSCPLPRDMRQITASLQPNALF